MKHMRTLRTNEEVLVETLRRVLAAIGMRFILAPAVRPPGQRTRRASRAV